MFKSKLALILVGVVSVLLAVGAYLFLSGGDGGYGESETPGHTHSEDHGAY